MCVCNIYSRLDKLCQCKIPVTFIVVYVSRDSQVLMDEQVLMDLQDLE